MNTSLQSEFYGDNVRWFFARVIDGSPPYGLEGRVKIRVIGVHSDSVEDIPQADLPWAQVLLPGTTYGSSGFGVSPQVLPGALVFGVFLDGKNSQLPLVLGSVPKIEYPTSVQADSRDDISTNPFAYEYTQSNYEGIDPNSRNLSVDDIAQRKTIALEFFMNNGYDLITSCCIVGVLNSISNLDPTYDNGNFYGIAGWDKTTVRWQRLNRFAKAFSPSKTVDSYDLQLMFVLNEMRTTRAIVNSKLNKSKSIKSPTGFGSFRNVRGSSYYAGQFYREGGCSVFYKYFLTGASKTLTSVDESEEQAELIYNGAIA